MEQRKTRLAEPKFEQTQAKKKYEKGENEMSSENVKVDLSTFSKEKLQALSLEDSELDNYDFTRCTMEQLFLVGFGENKDNVSLKSPPEDIHELQLLLAEIDPDAKEIIAL